MAMQIKGINTTISKLNKLSNISAKKAVDNVVSEVEKVIVNAASFSEEEKQFIGKCEVREYKTSYYVDVGLKNTTAPFDMWKGLWYHNWGYFNKGLNFNGTDYIKMHQLWFNQAVKDMESDVFKKIKYRLKEEIKEALK